MSTYTIPRTIKNEVHQTIERLELDPLDFEWSVREVSASTSERFTHKPTQSVFTTEIGSAGIWCTWIPSFQDGTRNDWLRSDRDVLGVMNRWLNRVNAEHRAPDLWGQLKAEADALTSTTDVDGSETFSATELRLLGEKIDAIEARVIAIAGTDILPERLEHVREVFEEAKAASSRLTKKDWKLFFLGTVANVLMTLSLDPAKAREILHYISITLSPIVTKIHGLLGP